MNVCEGEYSVGSGFGLGGIGNRFSSSGSGLDGGGGGLAGGRSRGASRGRLASGGRGFGRWLALLRDGGVIDVVGGFGSKAALSECL